MTGKKYSLEGSADMGPKRAYYWKINDRETNYMKSRDF
jgi:hypothetical protein